MIGVITLINNGIDTEISYGLSSEILDTLIVDIIDTGIQRSKYDTLTEVSLSILLGEDVYIHDIWIDMIDELLNGGFRWRKVDIYIL
jgi:hypothetical protein